MKALRVKKLYDGTLKQPVRNAVVVLNGATIETVLPECSENYLECFNLSVEDYSEYFMSPGLIDSHVHLMLPGDGTLGEDLLKSRRLGEIQILAYENAETALASGVTTLRDVGAACDVGITLRDFYRNSGKIGPDILCCGMPLTCTGGHCHYMGGEVDGPIEIQKMIRRQQKKGTNWVKVMATAGGTRGISQGDPFSLEELKIAVAESQRQGMGITMHASRINGLRKVAQSAPTGIEHCQFTDQWKVVEDKALAETICRHGIRPCHTMAVNVSILSYLKDKPKELWTTQEVKVYHEQRQWLDLMPVQLAFQLSQGVPTVGGSDAGWRYTSFHDGMIISMEMMQIAGMNTVEIIHACTGLNANYLRIDDNVGTIEAGKQADFLLLRKDPADTITNFRTIEYVYKKGYLIPSAWSEREWQAKWMMV